MQNFLTGEESCYPAESIRTIMYILLTIFLELLFSQASQLRKHLAYYHSNGIQLDLHIEAQHGRVYRIRQICRTRVCYRRVYMGEFTVNV